MATFCPTTKQINCLTPAFALAMLVPAVILFCAAYEAVELDGVTASNCCEPVALKTGLVIYECGVRPTFLPERQGLGGLDQLQGEYMSSSSVKCVEPRVWASCGHYEVSIDRYGEFESRCRNFMCDIFLFAGTLFLLIPNKVLAKLWL